ncbi:uncharacterized protein LOC128667447 [Microplitis demolitor]|uniref:uncharacterized protein LOC128667447 n=1 Tax=Microplitis demolitor TaxID=69319 RepID=UPI00235B629A|nr:uncharacterized protein LOC128667447 [Microplitis demolitor]
MPYRRSPPVMKAMHDRVDELIAKGYIQPLNSAWASSPAVFEGFRKAGIKMNEEKSHFGCSKVHFLGFIINEDGLKPDPARLEPIADYKRPTNHKESRRFNGLVNWYHKHLKNVAQVQGPLNKLTSTRVPWEWTDVEEKAFVETKEVLLKAATLSLPRPDLPYWLYIAYLDDISVITPTLDKYLEILEEVLKRLREWTEVEEALFQALKQAIVETLVMSTPDYSLPFVLYTDANQSGLGAVLIQRDDNNERLIACVLKSLTPAEANYSFTEKECLAVVWAYCYQKKNKWWVLQQAHDHPQSGHLRIRKTQERVKVRYYSPGMSKDIRHYVLKCETCIDAKPVQQKPLGLMKAKALIELWEVMAADTMSFTRSKSGFAYLIIFEDLYTQWIKCVPVRAANGKTVTSSFKQAILNRWGTPKVFWTDNGQEYIIKDVQAVIEECGIQHMTTPPYHAQGNPVERVNRNVKTMIMSYLEDDHREWDKYIYKFHFAYNTANQESLGVSPAFFNFSRDPCPMRCYRHDNDGIQLEADVDQSSWIAWMDRMVELRDVVNQNIRRARNAMQSIIIKLAEWGYKLC